MIESFNINEAEYENLKQLLEENNGEGYYYPLRNLYATCSSFSYLSELKYICVETGEFYYNTASRNINGVLHGMHYNGNKGTGILGYSVYNNGKMIKENTFYTDTHTHYRQINGLTYFEHEKCKRWGGKCNNGCKNCRQLNKIQKEIFSKDPAFEKIFNADYDNCKVIVRTPLNLEASLNLEYDTEGLMLSS